MNAIRFNAPWGKTLGWVSALSGLLLLAVAISALTQTKLPAGLQFTALSPLVILAGAALFTIHSRALGHYRAFVTDLKRTVVLRFEKKTIVISPENPEKFVTDIVSFIKSNS